jgi:O-antigen/teichoic acid export membrane protein
LPFHVSDKLQFVVTSFGVQALRVITVFVMARLLVPEDYGLLTLVAVAPGFLAALGDCGINRALVQYRDHPTAVVEASGLTISFALALIYAALFVVSGLYFYHSGYHNTAGRLILHDHRLPWIGLIGGVTAILAAIYNFQMACLNRDLKFRAESVQNLIFALALTATGLSLALVAHWHRNVGVFAVALQPLAAQIVGNAVIYRRHPFPLPRAFHVRTATMMLNYGWKVTVAQYVNNLQQPLINAFVLVVGGVFGSGVFGRATQIADMVGFNLLNSFDRLLYPLLRSIRDDRERLRGLFIRGCMGATLLCSFGWAWLYGTAPDLIGVVMGPKWAAVPPLLRIVSFALLTAGLGALATILTHALGRPLIWLRYAIINLAMLLLFIAAVMYYHRSLAALAAAYVTAQFITSVAIWIWVLRTLQIPPVGILGHLIRLTGAAVLSCLCILLVRHALDHQVALLRLIAGSAAGALTFIGLVLLVDREAILDFRNLIHRRPQNQAVPQPV